MSAVTNEKNITLRIGDQENFVAIDAPVPADDNWHQVTAVIRVRKSNDGKKMMVGRLGESLVAWYIDTEKQP